MPPSSFAISAIVALLVVVAAATRPMRVVVYVASTRGCQPVASHFNLRLYASDAAQSGFSQKWLSLDDACLAELFLAPSDVAGVAGSDLVLSLEAKAGMAVAVHQVDRELSKLTATISPKDFEIGHLIDRRLVVAWKPMESNATTLPLASSASMARQPEGTLVSLLSAILIAGLLIACNEWIANGMEFLFGNSGARSGSSTKARKPVMIQR